MAHKLGKVVKSLQGAVSDLTVPKHDPRERCLSILETQYELLKNRETVNVNQEDFATVRVRLFSASDPGVPNFFKPWSLQRLKMYPIAAERSRVGGNVRKYYECIDDEPSSSSRGFSIYTRLTTIHTCFISEVQRWPRLSPGNGDITHKLSFFTGWRFIEYVIARTAGTYCSLSPGFTLLMFNSMCVGVSNGSAVAAGCCLAANGRISRQLCTLPSRNVIRVSFSEASFWLFSGS